MRTIRYGFVTVLAVVLAAGGALAQSAVTAADITRLESTAEEIAGRLDTLRQADATLAADISTSLDDLRDEVTYLRVKLRREGSVTRDEYASVRDKLETLRVRAEGPTVSAQPVLGAPETSSIANVPVGTEFDVRLQTSLNSSTAKVEQRFEATTVLDYQVDGTVVVPAGSLMRGFVSSVRAAGRVDRRGSLTLSFDELRIGDRTYRVRAAVTEAIDAKFGEDTRRIGAGAVAGAILGGIIGGGRGALLGVLVGGGGTIAATDGTDVDLPAGTILRVRIDQSVDLVAPAAP
ncbi:MAG: hypothetical protein ABS36_04180 [Acidobacteria bacterium SCN 69-37]|nr:MAG: hypothetical protein ABS36_04180 [Acidobacteria bacterium SCN 69-37]